VGLGNYAVNAAPPDTNGAIGRRYTDGTGTHQWYVQWVNEAFAVFDAQTGTRVYGPANGNTLWQGFGGACQTSNPSDPINTLQPEASIFAGTGSQLRTLARWGDYSSLSVDPTDDCTMYFTTEYLATSGTFNWHTRVGKVKAGNCV
jgi:hypothetical protein